MLSDRDLRSARASDLDALVTELMSADVVSVGPESDALEVIDLMIDTKVGAVPVVDDEDGSLLGIISYVDVLRKLRAKLAEQDE
jgi:CBS domain-containing protein